MCVRALAAACLSIFCGSSLTLISFLVTAKDSEGDFLPTWLNRANVLEPDADPATTFNPLPIASDDASKSLQGGAGGPSPGLG